VWILLLAFENVCKNFCLIITNEKKQKCISILTDNILTFALTLHLVAA
jgi:hypothetical protein